VLRRPEAITVLLTVIALLVGGHFAPRLLDLGFLLDKTSIYMPVGMMALAMTLVIVAGQIDLSVASGTVLCSVVAGLAYRHGASMGVVFPVALGTGVVLGAFNGLLVGYLRLPALVVTLGTLALYRGLAQVLIGNDAVHGFPDWFCDAYAQTVGPVPWPVLLFVGLGLAMAFVLGKTTFGRRLVVIGTNERAARYAAVNVPLAKLLTFTVSGLFMGIAALLLISQLDSADHLQLKGGELLAITAVVLGGTSINGGRGSVIGTILALVLVVVVDSAMGMNNLRAEYKLAIIGALLVLAVLLADVTGRWKSR
jgi:rhamnose transport system permease protein